MQDALLEPPNSAGSAAVFSGQNSEGLSPRTQPCQVPCTSDGISYTTHPTHPHPPPQEPASCFLLFAACWPCAIFAAHVRRRPLHKMTGTAVFRAALPSLRLLSSFLHHPKSVVASNPGHPRTRSTETTYPPCQAPSPAHDMPTLQTTTISTSSSFKRPSNLKKHQSLRRSRPSSMPRIGSVSAPYNL